MVRLARVGASGMPHHITQRGNRRQPTFFCAEDYQEYIALVGEWCRSSAVEVWAYCLMPNHVHLIAVPDSEDGLRRAIGEAHRRYTRRNRRNSGDTILNSFCRRDILGKSRGSFPLSDSAKERPLDVEERRFWVEPLKAT